MVSVRGLRTNFSGLCEMSVGIQRLNSKNSELLNRIGPEVFDYPIDQDQLQAFLSDERHFMVVAVDEGTVVGMASAVEYFHPDKPPQFWINEVGVASTHRKRGIGRSLVEELKGIAKKRGCVYAWLGTDKKNKAAQRCFGSVPNGEAPQEFLLYEWDLEE